MASLYRDNLPQYDGGLFLSDGGLETVLVFQQGIELPEAAAYTLLDSEDGAARFARYFDDYLAIAREIGAGFILETPTWRANPEWASRIGTPPEEIEDINRRAVALLASVRNRWKNDVGPIVISGCVGPRSDAYRPTEIMSEAEAERFHALQIRAFSRTEADLVAAHTITNAPEAIGIVRAAQAAGIPAVVSFTVETDGRLPTGPTLREAIEQVDEAANGGPAYYMINCAHPVHFGPALAADESWTRRIRALRANASCRSHAELDVMETLDEGNPSEIGAQYRALLERLPHINVLGGCCGTDHRHIQEIARACAPLAQYSVA